MIQAQLAPNAFNTPAFGQNQAFGQNAGFGQNPAAMSGGFMGSPLGGSALGFDNQMTALGQQTQMMSQMMDQMMSVMIMMLNTMMLKQMQSMMSGNANFGGGNASGSSSGIGNFLGGGNSGASGGGGTSSVGGSSAPSVDPGTLGEGTAFGKSLAKYAGENANGPGGWCYKWVGKALAKHGVNVHGASAYMAADQLAKSDKFREVSVQPKDLAKLPAGAVVVWNKGAGHPHGHISIALGNGKEASDKLRTQITNYGTSVRVFLPK